MIYRIYVISKLKQKQKKKRGKIMARKLSPTDSMNEKSGRNKGKIIFRRDRERVHWEPQKGTGQLKSTEKHKGNRKN
jgi:hypothetical protein